MFQFRQASLIRYHPIAYLINLETLHIANIILTKAEQFLVPTLHMIWFLSNLMYCFALIEP